jgi:hypothetical protein
MKKLDKWSPRQLKLLEELYTNLRKTGRLPLQLIAPMEFNDFVNNVYIYSARSLRAEKIAFLFGLLSENGFIARDSLIHVLVRLTGHLSDDHAALNACIFHICHRTMLDRDKIDIHMFTAMVDANPYILESISLNDKELNQLIDTTMWQRFSCS